MYGSADGGQTVVNSHQTVSDLMTEAATFLHLARHYVKQELLASAGADCALSLYQQLMSFAFR